MSDENLAVSAVPLDLDREKVAMVLGDKTRMVSELAKLTGKSSSLISRHMGALGYAEMAVCERRLWRVPARFVVPGKRQLDFGHCLLRFPAPAA